MPQPPCPDRRPFTLLELLVGIVLVAMIFSMIAGSFVATTDAATEGREALATARAGRVILDRLMADLRGTYPPRDAQGDPLPVPADALPPPDPRHFTLQPNARQGMLRFRTTASLDLPDIPRGTVQAVAWHYDAESQTLFRRERSLLTPEARRPGFLAVAEGVRAFTLQGHDGEGWRDDWLPTRFPHPPPLLRVRLTLADAGGRTQTHELTVRIHAGRLPEEQPEEQPDER